MLDIWDKISVVFVVHNSISVIPDSLKSLENAKHLVVTDNASTDGSADLIKSLHPNATIIHNSHNSGVSLPCNMAFKKVETEFTLYMNPDITFDNACIEQLVHTLEKDANCAVVSPMIYNSNGDQEIDVLGPGEINHRKIEVEPSGPFCSWFVCGSLWLWRTEALRKIDYLDANIFLYNEDVDVCIRATQAGYSLIVDTEARIDHKGGASEKPNAKTRWRKDWNITWSHFYLCAKHKNIEAAMMEARWKLMIFALNVLKGVLLLKPKTVIGQSAKFAATVRFLRKKPSWLRKEWFNPPPWEISNKRKSLRYPGRENQ